MVPLALGIFCFGKIVKSIGFVPRSRLERAISANSPKISFKPGRQCVAGVVSQQGRTSRYRERCNSSPDRYAVPTLLTALVLVIALALLAGLNMVLKNLRTVSAGWSDEQVKISAFLKTSADDTAAKRLSTSRLTHRGTNRVHFARKAIG